MTLPRTLMTLMALLTAVACGGGDLEARLAEAGERLDRAKSAVAQARGRVEERTAAAATAQEELRIAKDELREAEAELAAVEREVDLSATDDVLFRAVQSRLLEDDALEDVAIAARVKEGVVTLSGVVPEDELRQRAAEVASETPGVTSVENRIQLLPAVAAPPR